MKGRKPIPAEIKKLTGTFRADRDGSGDIRPVWELVTAVPDKAPEWMLTSGKKMYRSVCQLLIDRRMLTTANIHQVAAMCQSYAKYMEAETKLRKEGSVTYTEKGYAQQSPWVSISSQSLREYLSIASTFGFDPISALKIKQPSSGHSDPMEDFFKEYGQ